MAGRGLEADGLLVLVVIDGFTGLRRAVADVPGNGMPVQVCRAQKTRKVARVCSPLSGDGIRMKGGCKILV